MVTVHLRNMKVALVVEEHGGFLARTLCGRSLPAVDDHDHGPFTWCSKCCVIDDAGVAHGIDYRTGMIAHDHVLEIYEWHRNH